VQRALPDGMLVRVSSIDEETPRAHAMQSAFIVAMAAALQGEARERILGEAAGQPAR